eukprot:CAMPEP_0181319656 /NCGR_PEP_ID=MMETSP1101-20121128/17694_1 /TAXON_ID=46948 /ORGANISM="Rhodomonas abbreviata, Strain Caron Lab Isolate" /LENGTH=198 /DNA_ID=CAMNT_0023427283 /DNA_START=9 /DNA_END=605 /DNA_ORIENTATION=+
MAVDEGSSDVEPIPRLDTCCFCIELKLGVLILCVMQMIFSGFTIAAIMSFVLWGGGFGNEIPMVGGAFTLLALLIILILNLAEFGFALYAFSDIRKAMPDGIRYYYMFKLFSLGMSLLVLFLTSDWTSYEIFNLFITTGSSLYFIWCIWSLHEALMLGGAAAEKAGFNRDEASQSSPLLRQSKPAPAEKTKPDASAYV